MLIRTLGRRTQALHALAGCLLRRTELPDPYADHINNVPRRFDEDFAYRTTRDRLESERDPHKAKEHEQRRRNEEAGVVFLVAVAALVWLGSSIWAWLTAKAKPVDAAIQYATDLHPWVVAYYKVVALALLGPPLAMYEVTRSFLRRAAWFTWSWLEKPLAWVVVLSIAAVMLGALVYCLVKWRWFRWLLPALLFGPILVALGLSYFSGS